MRLRRGIPHKVLNAKFHELEAEIVAEAGVHGAVTIATNMGIKLKRYFAMRDPAHGFLYAIKSSHVRGEPSVKKIRIGVDVGGTNTDICAID